jgi:hypothetical protein
MRILFCLIIFLLVNANANAQDHITVHALLEDIAKAQVGKDDLFIPGTFPSYRKCRGIPHNYQPDNNIFFTAISIFSLRQLLPKLNLGDGRIAQAIIDSAQKAFPFYSDSSGALYSFWQTGKGILPGSYFIHKFRRIDMGQDADDAVMSLMAQSGSKDKYPALKRRMMEVSNGSSKISNSTFKKYRKYEAYSTWLGRNMKPDFDLAVQCNILYCMLDNKIAFSHQDTATIELIASIIKNKDHVKHPAFVSPFYVRIPILLYHLARLMGKFKIEKLELYRDQLIAEMQDQFGSSTSLMDRILLNTSLIRMGIKQNEINIGSLIEFENATKRFSFFQARAAFSYPVFWKKIFLHHPYLIYDYYCPVYNKVLLLEYLTLKNTK